ncbi:putative quinol monooxygenase [Nocardioides immobilis]|nr:antibiotic biosynthesis monooxygenase family protein [Nocardioides immobilis]
MSVLVMVTITPKPECLDELTEKLQSAISAFHAEPGCDLYALHRTEDQIVAIERWRDADAFRAHQGGDAARSGAAMMAGKLARSPELQLLQALPAGDPAKGAVRP